jgi:excisionase family DNA binding protein
MATRSREAGVKWLSIAQASELVAVDQSTLRGWADSGRVRSFRTPGGHRRFFRDGLTAMTEQRASPREVSESLEETALRRIRRRLSAEQTAQSSSPGGWMERLSLEGRTRLRLFGRRLLDLSVAYTTQRRHRAAILEEVRAIGEEYGLDLGRSGVPLEQMVEAFIFFRNSLFDAVRDSVAHGPLRGNDISHLWGQTEQLTDQVLLSMVRAYERSVHAPVAASR